MLKVLLLHTQVAIMKRRIRHEPDAYLWERTLRIYRCRILELGLDAVLFRTLSDKLISATGVGMSKQRLDSAAVRSAIRGLT